jgi:hypothetical protein
MPYLHWESYRAVKAVSDLLDEIKEDSLETRILRGYKTWRTDDLASRPLSHDRRGRIPDPAADNDRPANPPKRTTNDIIPDDDNDLLRKYLFKRWPIHLRRTLDQYYYSYLADTKSRDDDQVVMRARNEEMHNIDAALHSQYYINPQESVPDKKRRENDAKHLTSTKGRGKDENIVPEGQNNELPKDGNSPLVMVDQLWLWVLDTGIFKAQHSNQENPNCS